MSTAKNGRNRVTLRDVAAQANVSASTVSRVLNGFAFVDDATRESVLRAAHELGYAGKTPKRVAQPGGARHVTMLVRQASTATLQEQTLANVERLISGGAQVVLQDGGFWTRIQPVDMDASDLRQQLVDDSVVGFIFLGGWIDPAFAALMVELDSPFVVAGAPVRDLATNCVTADYALGAELAVNHLVERSRTRIALINGAPQTMSSDRKYRGFRLALCLANLAYDSRRVLNGDFSPESGYAGTVKLLEQAPEVDGIVFGNDDMAMGGLHALKEHGRRVPDDVAVVGYHNLEAARFTDPPLTSVHVDLDAMGRIAGKRLAQLISQPSELLWTVVVAPQLVVRQSS